VIQQTDNIRLHSFYCHKKMHEKHTNQYQTAFTVRADNCVPDDGWQTYSVNFGRTDLHSRTIDGSFNDLPQKCNVKSANAVLPQP